MDRDRPHLPYPAPIETYRDGRFSFAGMSHRGSLLCLPDGIWASSVSTVQDIDIGVLGPVLTHDRRVELCLFGTGRASWLVPADLRTRFRERGIAVEAMNTGAAVHTYNILLEEGRRVAALLIALD